MQIGEVALRLLKVSSLPSPSCGECRELLDPLFRQLNPRSQRGFFVRRIVKLVFRSAQRGLGGFRRSVERHRVDLKKDVAFFDWPVWFDRHLGYLTGHAWHYRDDIILGQHIGRRRRYDVHEQNQDRQREDRDGDDDDLACDVPR